MNYIDDQGSINFELIMLFYLRDFESICGYRQLGMVCYICPTPIN